MLFSKQNLKYTYFKFLKIKIWYIDGIFTAADKDFNIDIIIQYLNVYYLSTKFMKKNDVEGK